jgi:hypothetical protein
VTAVIQPRTQAPGWWLTIWAVLCGSFVASALLFGLQLGFAETVEWPDVWSGSAAGWGWPWPVDGLWSFAADLGPALLFGVVFASVADAALDSHAGLSALRAPVALAAAALTLVTREPSEFIVFNLVGIGVLVVVIRRQATRPRRSIAWTWKSAGVVLGACVALAATTVSYGRQHALTAQPVEIAQSQRLVTVPVRGIGNKIVNLVSVQVRAARGVHVGVWNPAGTSISPVHGVSVHPGEAIRIALQAPANCAPTVSLDRLHVRMMVGDRALEQTLRLSSPVPIGCA